MEFEAHNKGISCLVIPHNFCCRSDRHKNISRFSSGNAIGRNFVIGRREGSENSRVGLASELQENNWNKGELLLSAVYRMTTNISNSFLRMLAGCAQFILNVQEGMTETFTWEPLATISLRDLCSDVSIKLFSVMEDSYGVSLRIRRRVRFDHL